MKKKKRKILKKIIHIFIPIFLLAIAFYFRIAYLSHLRVNDTGFWHPQPGTDMHTYHNFAKEIINGVFSHNEPYYYGPLYFYFLSLIYRVFGENLYIAKFIQMMLGVFTSLLIFLLAKKVFNQVVAYISLVLAIFYAGFYIHEGVLLIETLATFLNTSFVFFLLRTQEKPSYKNFTFAGIFLGLSALSRANILLFVPFVLIWRLVISNLRLRILDLKKFTFFCLVVLLTISPATIRNYLVSGKFVLISTNGPALFWIGNNPYATGEYKYPPPHYQNIVLERVKKEGDIVYLKEVFSFFKEKPKDFILLQFKKVLLFWSYSDIDNNINSSIQRSYSPLLILPIFIGFGTIAPLVLLGIFASLSKKTSLLSLFLFSGMLSTVVMTVLGRYRLCFVPIMIIFAGFSLYFLYKNIKKPTSLALSMILLVFFTIFVYSNLIYSKAYPFIHSEGFHIKEDDRIIIRDDSGLVGYGKSELNIKNTTIKKELIVKEDLSSYKSASASFNYGASSDPGLLMITINKKESILIKPMITYGLMAYSTVRFDPNILKKGKNEIEIKQVEEGSISIVIDYSYNFGRSYIIENEKEKRIKGEYMVWLSLQ
ncbi:TPA: hypothetical protein DCX16_01625 [bacterium]|nr:hypothetical protein [bacterium]